MTSLIIAVSLWCKASNQYAATMDLCKRRILNCVYAQKTEMDKQYCFHEPDEKPWPAFSRDKERQR